MECLVVALVTLVSSGEQRGQRSPVSEYKHDGERGGARDGGATES